MSEKITGNCALLVSCFQCLAGGHRRNLPVECQTCPALGHQGLELKHAYHRKNEVAVTAGSHRSIRSSQVQTFGKVAQWLERLLQMRPSCPFVPFDPIGGPRAPSSHAVTGALVQRSHCKWFYVRIVAFLQTIFLHPNVFLFCLNSVAASRSFSIWGFVVAGQWTEHEVRAQCCRRQAAPGKRGVNSRAPVRSRRSIYVDL